MSREHVTDFNTRYALNEQHNELQQLSSDMQRIEKQIKDVSSAETKKFIEEQTKKVEAVDKKRKQDITAMSQRIQTLESSLDGKIDSLETKVNSLYSEIAQKEQNKQRIAQSILQDAKDAVSLVSLYEHKKFRAGEYEKLVSEIKVAESNLSAELYEASIATTQQIIQKAFYLRAELVQAQSEWEAYQKSAFDTTSQILAQATANEIVKFMYEEDKDAEIELDVDYWSDGQLLKLKEKVAQQKQSILSDKTLKVDNFKTMIQLSSSMQQELETIVQNAKEALIDSQLRNDMATDIEDVFYQEGYEVVDSAYEGEDQKAPLWVKFQNHDDDEIITIISRTSKESVSIQQHAFEKHPNDNLTEARTQKINEQIEQATGVKIESSECKESVSSTHKDIEHSRDLDRIRSKKQETRG